MASFTQTIHASANGISLIEAADYAAMRTLLAYGTMADQAADSVNIDGGAIDGTTIGAASAAAGTFTTLSSGEHTIASDTVGLKLGASSLATLYSDDSYIILNVPIAVSSWGHFGASGAGIAYCGSNFYHNGSAFAYCNSHASIGHSGIYTAWSVAGSTLVVTTGAGPSTKDATFTPPARIEIGPTGDINCNANQLKVTQSTGEVSLSPGPIAIVSDTVGIKLGASGGQTIYSNGTNIMFTGGDIDANGNTIFFGAAENTQTPTGTTATINLGAENHHTLACGSASGDVTVTLTVPPGPTAGTIIVVQGATARDITWSPSAGAVVWLGTEPTWNADTNKTRIVSWRYNATNLFLSATDTN